MGKQNFSICDVMLLQKYVTTLQKMPDRGKDIADNRKPTIGIIYTDSETNSLESKSFAFFLAASLSCTGYAKVNLTGLRTDGAASDLQRQHKDLYKGGISFLPAGKSSFKDVKTESVSINNGCGNSTSNICSTSEPQIRFSHWNDLQYCQVVIVTVNSDDSEACCLKLATVLPLSIYRVVVFSLQRGVKNGGILKEGLKNISTKVSASATQSNEKEFKEDNTVAVVEGLVGFACVPVLQSSQLKISTPGRHITDSVGASDPLIRSVAASSSSTIVSFHYYACTLKSPQILLERLSKAITDLANGPVNLLETIGIDFQFRKILTLTGGDLVSTMSSRRYRLILALMIRESRETLLKAARGGKWSPDMSLITFHLTPWLFEMALAIPLPWPCYLIFWSFLNLVSGCVLPWGNLCSIGVRSPAQCDLLEGRRTMTDLHLAEIVLASERYKVDTPMCHAVLSTIRTLENTNVASLDSTNIKKTTPLISIDSYSDPNAVKGRMSAINRAYTSRTDDAWHRHPGVWESSYRCVQIGVTLLAVLVLMAILAEVLEP